MDNAQGVIDADVYTSSAHIMDQEGLSTFKTRLLQLWPGTQNPRQALQIPCLNENSSVDWSCASALDPLQSSDWPSEEIEMAMPPSLLWPGEHMLNDEDWMSNLEGFEPETTSTGPKGSQELQNNLPGSQLNSDCGCSNRRSRSAAPILMRGLPA
ncbi:hypothetical protein BU24DRAFT_413882 [Aaosphaeria arxii CBS 175.79]|uniref:Uncharacterized protein n=1 Tax=Aaosphaeria arxii CBS 175.79 TaxID=1450172 RepID=A0A6A5XBC4_9PLEO|nr:uncharacterized protein BU24DRAFT_413882 [Aaosphaeria arxii CBS 175.79]KAF2010272.1 hypothetical protein BU24DRAFT_413882 [Aaosphaeria arxii CBS 175.79]